MDASKSRESLLLRPREAAELLGLSLSEVYGLCRRNELPVVRVSRAVRVHRARLLAWCDERVEHAEPER